MKKYNFVTLKPGDESQFLTQFFTYHQQTYTDIGLSIEKINKITDDNTLTTFDDPWLAVYRFKQNLYICTPNTVYLGNINLDDQTLKTHLKYTEYQYNLIKKFINNVKGGLR